jgi:hypothetical protein
MGVPTQKELSHFPSVLSKVNDKGCHLLLNFRLLIYLQLWI